MWGSTVLTVGLSNTSWLEVLASFLKVSFFVITGGFIFNTPVAYLPFYPAERHLSLYLSLGLPCHEPALLRLDYHYDLLLDSISILIAQTTGLLS